MSNPADAYYFYPRAEEVSMQQPMVDQVFSVLDKYGVSFFTVLCAFWFILYLTKQSAREREAFLKIDTDRDQKLLNLVQTSSDALLEVKVALEANTQAMREFIRYRRD